MGISVRVQQSNRYIFCVEFKEIKEVLNVSMGELPLH